MAGGYLDNLLSSFGDASREGPDPTRLEGLAELARQRLQQGELGDLGEHMERMRGRIRQTLRDREAGLEERRSLLHADLLLLIERNLNACRGIDESLGAFLATQDPPAALQAYEISARDFLESSDQLAALAAGSQPLCPRCGSAGPEPLCPDCQLDRLVPDADFSEEEFLQAPVNEEAQAVYQAYVAVVEGKAGLAPLSQALQSLEFSLLEAQALIEPAVEEEPENQGRKMLLEAVNLALTGLQRMHAVEQNRQTRELHQGWHQLFRGAATVTQLLPGLNDDD